MAKKKGQKIMLLVLLLFSFGHCVACPVIFSWSLCCLSFCQFLLTIVLLVRLLKGQKDKQHNDQKKMTEGQATQWPKEKD
jgi:hypothetical protein